MCDSTIILKQKHVIKRIIDSNRSKYLDLEELKGRSGEISDPAGSQGWILSLGNPYLN